MKFNWSTGTVLVTLLVSTTAATLAQTRVNVPRRAGVHAPVEYGRARTNAVAGLPLETFDTFLPDGWKKITNFGGIGWQQGAVDSAVLGFERGVIDAPPGGGNFVAYASWATGDEDGDFGTGQPTDQWLITPRINGVQPGDSLRFWLRHFSQFTDNLDILISVTGDSIAAFDSLLTSLAFTGNGDNQWKPYAFALTDVVSPGDSIYIAFRERVANTRTQGDALLLDLVEVVNLVTSVNQRNRVPHDFVLEQNFPNPFNPTTTIAFTLRQPARVTLRVYNLLGRVVATLVEDKRFPTGRHRVRFAADRLPDGIYFYRLEANGFTSVKKMTLVR